MNETVKQELDKMKTAINNNLEFVTSDKVLSEELVRLQFSSIKDLVNYCENLVLKGEEAIE